MSISHQPAQGSGQGGVLHGHHIEHQGHQEEPAEDAPRGGDCAVFGPDNIANRQKSGRRVGGEHGEGPIAHAEGRLLVAADQRDPRAILEELQDPGQRHGPEYSARARLTALARLDDLGASLRLGEGEAGVLNECAPQQRDEQHTQHAAHGQKSSGHEPVGRAHVYIVPGADDDERRHGEDGSGGQGLTHGPGGPGQVFLKDVALEQAQHGHGHYRSGEGRRHGHARLQAKVNIG